MDELDRLRKDQRQRITIITEAYEIRQSTSITMPEGSILDALVEAAANGILGMGYPHDALFESMLDYAQERLPADTNHSTE